MFKDCFEYFDKLLKEEKNTYDTDDPSANIQLNANNRKNALGAGTESEMISSASHSKRQSNRQSNISNKDGKRN